MPHSVTQLEIPDENITELAFKKNVHNELHVKDVHSLVTVDVGTSNNSRVFLCTQEDIDRKLNIEHIHSSVLIYISGHWRARRGGGSLS